MNPASFLRRLIGGSGRRSQVFQLCDALLAERGEYASTALARETLAAYQGLGAEARTQFFEVLARAYSPSPDAVARWACPIHMPSDRSGRTSMPR